MITPTEIFKKEETIPDKNNLEGKRTMLIELVEFMPEEQVDSIIKELKKQMKIKSGYKEVGENRI